MTDALSIRAGLNQKPGSAMADPDGVKDALRAHEIELPSWAFGNTGTRFKVFGQPGVPRTPWEKADDAAQVHRFTGVAPSMAVHIPWDKVEDYGALAGYAAERASLLAQVGDFLRARPETAAGEFVLPLVTVTLRARRK